MIAAQPDLQTKTRTCKTRTLQTGFHPLNSGERVIACDWRPVDERIQYP
jgi:hypothetical protein